MARGQTIIVGGGINPGSPFGVNGIPYIVQVTPPFVATTDFLSVVPTGTNRGVIISTTGDPLASTNRLRVKGGIVSEHASFAGSVVVGQNHTVTGSYANGFVFFGRDLTLSSAAGANPIECVFVGADNSVTASASNANACVVVGSNNSVVASTVGSMVVVGFSLTATGAGGPSVAIGTTMTYSANGNGIMIGNGTSITGGPSTLCTVIGDNASAAGSSCTCIGQNAVAGGTATSVVAIGVSASSTQTGCTIVGTGCVNTHTGNIMLGRALTSFQTNTCMIGSTGAGDQIQTLLIGAGNTLNAAGLPLAIRMTDCSTAGADRVGGSLTIQSGAGTGAGAGSQILLQTPTPGGAGTTAQTKATRLTLDSVAAAFVVPVTIAGATSPQLLITAAAGGNVAIRFNGFTNGAGVAVGTLNNSPAAGDPAFWLRINIAGTDRFVPCW